MRRQIHTLLAMALSLGGTAGAQAGITLLHDTVIDPRGMVLAPGAPYGRNVNGLPFVESALVSLNGYQYSAYWAVVPADGKAGHVAVARRKLPDGAWDVIDLPGSEFHNGLNAKTKLPWDAHNVVSLGLCAGDGSLHVAYDHHNNTLRYRQTKPGVATNPSATPWTPDVFGPENPVLIPAEGPMKIVCYPAFIDAPGGAMQMAFRRGQSGDGSWWLVDYDPATHAWTRGWQYNNGHVGTYITHLGPSPQRCAYPNGWTYGPDGTLHCSFVYRENFGPHRFGNGSNHDIDYVQSPDQGRTWKNNAGVVVSDRDSTNPAVPKLYNVNSPGLTVVPMPETDSLMNEQSQAVDSTGLFHTVMWHLDPAKADPADKRTWQPDRCSYYHYWREADGTWKSNMLPGAVGNRPQMEFDQNDTAYVVYTLPTGPDTHTRDIYYEHGRLVIATATAAHHWSDWTLHDAAPGPFGTEALFDHRLLRDHGVLSIFMQDTPGPGLTPTPIRALDFATDR